jgi:hypothetical protein
MPTLRLQKSGFVVFDKERRSAEPRNASTVSTMRRGKGESVDIMVFDIFHRQNVAQVAQHEKNCWQGALSRKAQTFGKRPRRHSCDRHSRVAT